MVNYYENWRSTPEEEAKRRAEQLQNQLKRERQAMSQRDLLLSSLLKGEHEGSILAVSESLAPAKRLVERSIMADYIIQGYLWLKEHPADGKDIQEVSDYIASTAGIDPQNTIVRGLAKFAREREHLIEQLVCAFDDHLPDFEPPDKEPEQAVA